MAVAKTIEIISSSPTSIEDAVQSGIAADLDPGLGPRIRHALQHGRGGRRSGGGGEAQG